MTAESYESPVWHEQLTRKGYCVIPEVLGRAALVVLTEHFSDISLAAGPAENFGDAGAFLVADYHDPVLVDVLTWPKTMRILAELGYTQPKLHNYYISTKPPGADALPWHSDLFYDYDKTEPSELFLIYYLQTTRRHNGCLRVVPGSHLWLPADRTVPLFDSAMRSDEVDVLIAAGDLFIGDRRILHATHANTSDTWRTALTIAYAPDFKNLPASIQALIVQNQCLPPPGWQNTAAREVIDTRLQAILPMYEATDAR